MLANSEPLHLRALQEALDEFNVSVDRQEYYARYLGYDDVGAIRAIGTDKGQTWSSEEVSAILVRKSAVFDDLLSSNDVLYPEAVACVERLATRFPLGIASGALRHEIEAILRNGGLDGRFRFIVASGDTAAGKPAPDPYARAAALHGLPPARCVAIEDSRWGIESAKGAGLRCVGITQSYPASELAAADAVIASLDEFTEEMILGLGGALQSGQ